MAQGWRWKLPQAVMGPSGLYDTGQDAKPAGGAKMGDPKDAAMEALLQAQNLAIQGLKDEIERLRKLMREAYEEGRDDGYGEEMGRRSSWEISNARKALEGLK